MKIIKSFLLLFVFSQIIFSCGEKQQQEEAVYRPVNYQVVSYIGSDKTRTFSGTSKTDEIVNLSFRNGGIVTFFEINLGQNVEKGQLLAKLDNVQARLNYENSISSLNSAASQMNTAKLNLNRIRSLYEKGSTSLSDYEAAKNSFRTAEASHESAKRSVAIQRDQINYGFLYAPANGVISSVNTEINENVSAGQNIAVLNVTGDMQISLGLPESVINNVKKDMMVDIAFPSIEGKTFKGKVTEVSPALDSNTSTYPVRVVLVSATSEVKSGMSANVTFDFKDKTNYKNTIVVPVKSVGADANGKFVFVIEDDSDNFGIAKKQLIEIGDITSDGFEVVSGLQVGQKIATAGLQTLLDGQKVKL